MVYGLSLAWPKNSQTSSRKNKKNPVCGAHKIKCICCPFFYWSLITHVGIGIEWHTGYVWARARARCFRRFSGSISEKRLIKKYYMAIIHIAHEWCYHGGNYFLFGFVRMSRHHDSHAQTVGARRYAVASCVTLTQRFSRWAEFNWFQSPMVMVIILHQFDRIGNLRFVHIECNLHKLCARVRSNSD